MFYRLNKIQCLAIQAYVQTTGYKVQLSNLPVITFKRTDPTTGVEREHNIKIDDLVEDYKNAYRVENNTKKVPVR